MTHTPTEGFQFKRRAPLAIAALAVGLGIWISQLLPRSPAQWAASALLLAASAVAAAMRSRALLAYIAALLALVCAGAFSRMYLSAPLVLTPPPEYFSDEKVEVTGHLVSDAAPLPGGDQRVRIDLQTESISLAGRQFAEPVLVRATVYRNSRKAAQQNSLDTGPEGSVLKYGARVRFLSRLRLPRNFRNPGAFDYVDYLHGLGISTLTSVDGSDLEILPGSRGTRVGYWRSGIRRSILKHIGDPQIGLWRTDEAPLFAAMIIGEDGLLLRNVRDEFQQTGMYHLLVVSGMNVALLAFAVFWVARRLHAPDWFASLITIALSIFYAYIAGMGVPIQRAVLMLSLFLIARLIYRDRAALNATGFAALIVLVISPEALFQAGFQLTFLALLAITGISLPILQRTSAKYRHALRHLDSTSYDLTLDPNFAQLRLDLRLIRSRVGRFIGTRPAQWLLLFGTRGLTGTYELLVISTITQAALVAPMRAYFHRAAILGIAANIFVLPFSGVLLNSGVAAIALSYISRPLAQLAAFMASAALYWTLSSIHWLSHLHVSRWRVPDMTILLWLLAPAGISAALATSGRRRIVAITGLAAFFASAGFIALYHTPPGPVQLLEITAIDVGQGDSLLIVSPQGKTLLVDAGGSIGPGRSEFDYGEDVVSPYLWYRGIDHLDAVALTHAHGDHIGGLARVIENFRPHELWVGINPETSALDHVLDVAAQENVQLRKHTATEEFEWGGAHIRVLSPPADWQPRSEPKNDDSLAFVISFGNTSALMAGDLENNMERFIASENPRANLLKVAHHGSATSTTPELLEAARPQFAIISAGYRNAFGHPRLEVLERLQTAHVRTYRTDMFGGVTFILDGRTVTPKLNPPY